MEQTKKKKFQMPSAYTVLFIIIAVIAVLTWFIPAGHYSVDDAGNIVAGSYERVQQNPQGLWDILSRIVAMSFCEPRSWSCELSS